MNYQEYDIPDFLQDEFFVSWVREPTRESELFWRSWSKQHPHKIHTLNNARKIILSLQFKHFSDSSAEKDKALTSILQRISESERTPGRESGHGYKVGPPRRYVWPAAAAIACLLFFCFYSLYMPETGEQAQTAPSVEWVKKNNPAGVKSKIKLPDGTVVHLNARSQLTLPKRFAADKREVYLEGEAFFVVAEDSSRPFTVHAQGIATTALGTSFNIKTGKKKSAIHIALVSGKVRVSGGATGEQHKLFPNEMLSWQQAEARFTKSIFDAEDVIAWTRNTLVFNNADFTTILSLLSDWYGVTFEIKKRPSEVTHYSGRFNNQSLEQVLESISFSSGFTYQINGKTVIINQKRL